MHALPVVAAILAAVDAALRADEQHFRVVRMDGNGPRLRHRGQAVRELLPVRLTGFLTIQAMGFGTGIDIRFVCHMMFLPCRHSPAINSLTPADAPAPTGLLAHRLQQLAARAGPHASVRRSAALRVTLHW